MYEQEFDSIRLVNGGKFHFVNDPAVWVLIAVLLLYLSMLTLLHYPFDKGKHDLNAFIFKNTVLTKNSTVFQTSSSRNILFFSNFTPLNFPLFVIHHINYVEYLISNLD